MQFLQLFILLHNPVCQVSYTRTDSHTHTHTTTNNGTASCRRKRQRQMPDLATVWVRPYYEHLDANAHTSIGTYHIETTMLSTLKLAVVGLFSSERTKPRRASVFLLTALPLHIAHSHTLPHLQSIFFLSSVASSGRPDRVPCVCVCVCLYVPKADTFIHCVFMFNRIQLNGVINFYLPSFYVNTVTMAMYRWCSSSRKNPRANLVGRCNESADGVSWSMVLYFLNWRSSCTMARCKFSSRKPSYR